MCMGSCLTLCTAMPDQKRRPCCRAGRMRTGRINQPGLPAADPGCGVSCGRAPGARALVHGVLFDFHRDDTQDPAQAREPCSPDRRIS